MKKGEKGVLIGIALVVLAMMFWNSEKLSKSSSQDKEIPFFSDASMTVKRAGAEVYRRYQCKSCHSLWTVKDIMQTVPAPALDGVGSLRDAPWLARYLAAADPQKMLPSRLKKEYRMPSYSAMPKKDREVLVSYLASLKVKSWYLDELKRAECRKLTGGPC